MTAKVWRLVSLALAAFAVVGFVGTAQAQTFVGTGTGNVVGAYPNFTINASDSPSGDTDYQATFASATAVTFTWTYHTDDDDPHYDPASYLVGGARTQLTDNFGPNDQSGTLTVNVAAGQSFGWRVRSDGCCGTASLTISATVPASSAGPDGHVAQNFVAGRQLIITDALNFPDIFNHRSNGVQVQQGSDGAIDGLAFAAASGTSTDPISPASDAVTRALLDRPTGAASSKRAPFSFWIDGQMGLHSSNGGIGRFAVTSMGADTLVNDRFLVGFAIEGDWVTAPTASSSTSGLGFMAGPYVSVAIDEHLALSARLLGGKSWNSISESQGGNTYTGDFQTSRLDVGASLSGDFTMDLLTVLPDVSFSLFSEGAGAYTISGAAGSIGLPAFNVSTYELRAGSQFEYRLDQGNGVIFVPKAGLNLVLDFGTAMSPFAVGNLGLGLETESGLRVGIGVQSRVGTSGISSVTAQASAGAAF